MDFYSVVWIVLDVYCLRESVVCFEIWECFYVLVFVVQVVINYIIELGLMVIVEQVSMLVVYFR